MGARTDKTLACVVLALVIAGCGSSTAPSTTAGPTPAPGSNVAGSPGSSAQPTTAVPSSAEPSAIAGTGCELYAPKHHDVPTLEAMLPERVGQRTLYRWSVHGRCFVDLAYGGTPSGSDAVLKDADAIDPAHPLDLEHLSIAVAGRSDTKKDPPYFVWALARPATVEETTLGLTMLFGGASFVDVSAAMDFSSYHQGSMGGKTVYIGTKDMVEQSEHERGVPYLYETDDVLFLVVADDASWAVEAIKKLP